MTSESVHEPSDSLKQRVAALGLGDFMHAEMVQIATTLGFLDIDREFPEDFGREPDTNEMGQILALSPSAQLSESISDLHQTLIKADPDTVLRSRGFFARLTGKRAEAELQYRLACSRITDLVDTANRRVMLGEHFVGRVDRLVEVHEKAIVALRCDLAAGRLHLQDLTLLPDPEASTGGTRRERFGRRLTNLALILQSTQLALAQLQMMSGQIQSQMDRLGQASKVLFTIWRNQAFAVLTQPTASPELASAYSLALSQLEGNSR